MADAAILDISETVRQAQSGDTAAFAVIVRQYQSLVGGVLYSMTGDFHRSEDLAQETFLIAWNKLADLRAEENVAAWLCAIARNLAHRSFRKKTVDTVHGSLDADKTSTEPEPDAELQRREQSELVWSALEEIPEAYRETLVLFYRSGQSIRDIAEATQSSEAAVKQKLYRARQSLRSKLEAMIGDILTDTAPNEMFTLTVLAAIPLAVTASGCSATSKSLGIVSGGAALGGPWFVLAVLTCFAFLLFHSTASIALAAVTFYMLWQAVKRSPTLRTRRFVIGAALDFNILLWGYYFFERYILNGLTHGHRGPGIDLVSLFGIFPEEARAFLFGGLPVFLLFSAFMLHVTLRWRQLDTSKEPGMKTVLRRNRRTEASDEASIWAGVFERERNFIHRARRKIRFVQYYLLSERGIRRKFRICMTVAIFFLLLSIALGIGQHAVMFSQTSVSGTVLTWFWGATAWFYFLQIIYQTVFFRIIDRGIKLPTNRTATESRICRADNHEKPTSSEHRKILKDAVILLLAIPLATMLLGIALGFARQMEPEPQEIGPISDMTRSTPGNPVSYYVPPLPSDQIIQIVQIEIVLIFLVVLWALRNGRHRYFAFALLFFVTGAMAAGFIEWVPLFQGELFPRFAESFYWWLPESDKELFRLGTAWEGSLHTRYFYWHVFAGTWLAYSTLAALSCLALQWIYGRYR